MVVDEHRIFCHLHTSTQKKEGKILRSSLAGQCGTTCPAFNKVSLKNISPTKCILLSVSFCCCLILALALRVEIVTTSNVLDTLKWVCSQCRMLSYMLQQSLLPYTCCLSLLYLWWFFRAVLPHAINRAEDVDWSIVLCSPPVHWSYSLQGPAECCIFNLKIFFSHSSNIHSPVLL